ncbi:MAG: esterase [Rubrivivax sp.]
MTGLTGLAGEGTAQQRFAATTQPSDLPIEWLPAAGAPEQLIVLLHGWRSEGAAMAPLAQALRNAFPQAAVLAPDSPLRFVRAEGEREAAGDPGREAGRDEGRDLGRMWYSIEGLTPATWPERVAACLPSMTAWLRAQQQRLGVGPAATALGGFSQGAIVSLAAVLREDGLAGRVLAFGGCITAPPAAAPQHTTVHLFHGGADTVIPADGSRQALQWLGELQGDATLDIAEGVGHELHAALIDCALHRLTHHIPLRTWRAALGGGAATT